MRSPTRWSVSCLEADKIGDEYARGELTLDELHDGLDDLTGITRMEGR